MNCPNCHMDMPENSSACPHCGQRVIRPSNVVDAELVDDGEHGSGGYRQSHSNVFFFTSASSPFYSPVRTGVITLALAVAMGIQYGFLAILGFLFFYAALSLLSLALRINMLFKGYVLPPLLIQCCTWLLCWLIVSHLAS